MTEPVSLLAINIVGL